MTERDQQNRKIGGASSQPGQEPSEFSKLAHLFVELRGRGLSLSATDVELLMEWQRQGLSPEFIAKVMVDLSIECREKQKLFPANLVPVARRLKQLQKQQSEF